MKGEVIFTMKEIKSYEVIQPLLEKKLTNKQAALALCLSKRQVQRIKKEMK